MTSARRAAALTALALAGVSCADDGAAPAAPPVALEDFGVAAQRAVCDWAVRCRHVPNRPTCERTIDPDLYDVRRALDAVAAGRLAYDASAGGACVDAHSHQACLSSPMSSAPCRAMFRGLRSGGETCTSNFECEGAAVCELERCGQQCCMGRCRTVDEVPSLSPVEIGGRCRAHFDCVADAYCETDGRCTPLPTEEGQRCLFGCGFGDLYCDLDRLECRRYAGAGESCDPEGALAPPCDEAWAYCDDDEVCRPRPGPGEPCELAGPAACIPGSYCDGGRCRIEGRAGDPCSDDLECQLGCDLDAGACLGYLRCESDLGEIADGA